MRTGPIYELLGLRLQDVDAGCGRCGKRLAEIHHDSDGNLVAGQLYCVDCGTVAPAYDNPAHEIRIVMTRDGKRLPLCSCRRLWAVPGTLEKARRAAEQHVAGAA